jgi:hypothetical protein
MTDITGRDCGPSASESSHSDNRDLDNRDLVGAHTRFSRSVAHLPQPSEAEGLALLGDGPPLFDTESVATAGTEPDQNLLDYDSEESEFENGRHQCTMHRPSGSSNLMPAMTAMETEPVNAVLPTPEMDDAYYQCNSARSACRKETLVSVSLDNSFGKTVTVQSPPIGSLLDHGEMDRTFHGSRVTKGQKIVNETICCSFDPGNLTCLSCTREHNIIEKVPVIIALADQNFPATLGCDEGKCINIVRMENASLMELFEIAREMFASVSLPEGSVLLIGSASYLGRTGTSQYAKSWTEVVALSSSQWRGVRICPLIPFVLSECPGSIVRELAELAMWFDKIYDTDPQGLKESWFCLIKAMENNSTGMISLDSMDSYKVILPGSLLTRDLDYTATFCSNSSRPVIFKGLSKDNQSELLGTLLGCIYDNFRACKRPEDYLARADVDKKISESNEQKVFLVGASNLRRSIPHFADSSLQFEDVTSPG